jgi:hypothetical protein
MNLYLVERKRSRGRFSDYGLTDAFVIAAKDSRTARKMASSEAGSYDSLDWTSSNDATCQLIGTAAARVKMGIVLESHQSE